VLEAEADISGVWSKQYTSLKITTRRAHCGLPHYPVPQSYAADTAQRTGHSTDGKLVTMKTISYTLLALLCELFL
jgi:cation diffusion facilitator CzcD-associated flavoprotein CzcO